MPRYLIHIGLHETITEFLHQYYLPSLKEITVLRKQLDYSILRAEDLHNDIVISSDELAGLPWNKLRRDGVKHHHSWMSDFERSVKNIKKLYPKAEIIIVFRKHGEMALSLYKKYIKEGGVLKFNQFFSIDSVLKPEDLDFKRRVEILNGYFDNVHVLDYELFRKYGDGYLYLFLKSINLEPNPFVNLHSFRDTFITSSNLDILRKANMIFFKLPKFLKAVLRKIKATPRHIFDQQIKFRHNETDQYFDELTKKVNLKFKQDWDLVSRHFFRPSAIDIENIKLRAICSYDSKEKESAIENYYGIGYWYKKYANFPTALPIRLHLDHAPSLQETILKFDETSPYDKAIFHNNLKVKDNTVKQKFKKVYIGGSAFVHYRQMHRIEQSKKAKGTLCLPLHSAPVLEVIMDYDAYMDDLLKLPSKYHPLTICLFYIEIQNGIHLKFLKRGFNVVTAGNRFDEQFPVRFYEILKNKKYVTSNAYGSFIPYAIEMGIPFFYYGQSDDIKINNKGDERGKLGVISLEEHRSQGRRVSLDYKSQELFKEPTDVPTESQINFTKLVLGSEYQISPIKLRMILWKEYLIYEIRQIFNKNS